MGKGILAAVAAVFKDVPDFICHFHFLRDIGKDLFEEQYVTIVPTLQPGNAARDAPASRVNGESIWPEAAMSSWNRTSPIF
jgi:hypothetical protein